MREEVPVICPTPQAKGLRQIGTTGKSGGGREKLSSDKQLLGTAVIARSQRVARKRAQAPRQSNPGSFLRRDWIASLAVRPGDIAYTCSGTWLTRQNWLDSSNEGASHAVAKDVCHRSTKRICNACEKRRERIGGSWCRRFGTCAQRNLLVSRTRRGM